MELPEEPDLRAQLQLHCRALDVAALRELLPSLTPAELNEPFTKKKVTWGWQDSALSTVLEQGDSGAAEEALRLLLEARADPNGKGVRRRVPLLQCKTVGAARLLLEARADVQLDSNVPGDRGNVLQVAARVANPDVVDVLLAAAGAMPRRDVLHEACRRGSKLAARELEPFLQVKRPADVLEFALPDGGLRVLLAQGDLCSWPCEVVLCDVNGDDFEEIAKASPGLLEQRDAYNPYGRSFHSINGVPADGALPAVYVLCACFKNREAQGSAAPGAAFGSAEEELMRTLLEAFHFVERRSCARLALPALGVGDACGQCGPEEAAGVFLNAVLLHCRRAPHSEQDFREVSVVVASDEEHEAYRRTLARLTASAHRLRWFRDLAPIAANTCPEPLRKPRTHALGDAVLDAAPLPPRRCRDLAAERGFVVEALLSSEECGRMVAAAEAAGLESVAWEYSKDYRDCRRAIFHDSAVASQLWGRLAPLLRRGDLHEVTPLGWDAEGVWTPCGLNECLRVSRYDLGGRFAMHRDGPFVLNSDTRSIFTVLVYLSDGFQGGSTAFKAGDAVEPFAGGALVFTHDTQHEGQEVTGGSKYVLRTDLMFRRVDALSFAQQGPRCVVDPAYHRCEALYHESITLQNEGDPEGSTRKYLEALEMQAQLASVRCKREGTNGALPDSVWAVLLQYLSVREGADCAALSRRSKRLARDPGTWREHYARRWGQPARSSGSFACWYSLYKYRCAADECWRVACFEVGFSTTRYTMLGPRPAAQAHMRASREWGSAERLRDVREEKAPVEIGRLPSIIAKARGHYWSAHSGFKHYHVGHDALSRTGTRGAYQSLVPDTEVFLELIRYIFAFGFEEPCWPLQHPLLLVVPPHLSPDQRSALAGALEGVLGATCDRQATTVSDYGYERVVPVCVPYLLLESCSVLALRSVGEHTGLHVHLAEVCSITAVSGGAALAPAVVGMPGGLGFVSLRQPESGAMNEARSKEMPPTAQFVDEAARRELEQQLVAAVREAALALGARALPAVVTADDGDACWLAEGVRAALRAAEFVVAEAEPTAAALEGAVLLAATPEGCGRFRGAEAAAPPVVAPVLQRR